MSRDKSTNASFMSQQYTSIDQLLHGILGKRLFETLEKCTVSIPNWIKIMLPWRMVTQCINVGRCESVPNIDESFRPIGRRKVLGVHCDVLHCGDVCIKYFKPVAINLNMHPNVEIKRSYWILQSLHRNPCVKTIQY